MKFKFLALGLTLLFNAPAIAAPCLSESDLNQIRQAVRARSNTEAHIANIAVGLIRANNLGNQEWRIEIVEDYDPQGFFAKPNLIRLPKAAIEQFLDEDPDALACLLAREIAHHTQQHLPGEQRIFEQEYDADRYSYQLIVRSDYDPDGCYRALEFVERRYYSIPHRIAAFHLETMKFPAYKLYQEVSHSESPDIFWAAPLAKEPGVIKIYPRRE